MAALSARPATFEDLLSRDDIDRLEIIGGQIVEKASPSAEHSFSETKLIGLIDPFNRKPGSRGPGGWWILTEIHTAYQHGELYCHDAAGWRRDRANRPTGWPVRIRPDWVCEIVSPDHEKRDLIDKPRVLHLAEVPHYWTIDPAHQLLLVHRWAPGGYEIVQRATAGETVRAEPFEAIELRVSELLGFDDD